MEDKQNGITTTLPGVVDGLVCLLVGGAAAGFHHTNVEHSIATAASELMTVFTFSSLALLSFEECERYIKDKTSREPTERIQQGTDTLDNDGGIPQFVRSGFTISCCYAAGHTLYSMLT